MSVVPMRGTSSRADVLLARIGAAAALTLVLVVLLVLDVAVPDDTCSGKPAGPGT